ncbi:hypothetical protein VSDG_01510 [Cytospora chrysosperma]|uniref:Alpha/beta hydrolase fold-3 domain-containing protein n=1 Tax=Cytospora chrysosperma TaxID=252740 RepID=A0A423WJG5_CYTCH|nr:hypothetical protein VSDG_01510 [Valsa sordida]
MIQNTFEYIVHQLATSPLHNVNQNSPSTPLIINLPAFPTRNVEDLGSYLPRFLHHFPTATIHYRWAGRHGDLKAIPSYAGAGTPPPPPPHDPSEATSRYRPNALHWPTPLHDTIFGYEWLVKNLSPEGLKRRTVYAYGSYLGASLASSLALTESHTHKPMAVRGLLAFNGIYNWSRMLPGHPNNLLALKDAVEAAEAAAEAGEGAPAASPPEEVATAAAGDQDVAPLKELAPALFRSPSNLFDPFASPVLFFHTAGMLVPPGFGTPRSYRDLGAGAGGDPADLPYVYSDPEDPAPPTPYEEGDLDAGPDADPELDLDLDPSAFRKWPPPPRKGYFAFPPRMSSLRIPETLLMHSTPTVPATAARLVGKRPGPGRPRKRKVAGNTFEAHARGLADMMRKSINRLELSERMNWDPDIHAWQGEAARRVSVEDVGEVVRDGQGRVGESGLSDRGEDIALRWLEERLG